MNFPRFLILFTIVLFATIGTAAYLKKNSANDESASSTETTVEQVDLAKLNSPAATPVNQTPNQAPTTPAAAPAPGQAPIVTSGQDRIEELFRLGEPKSPIVETVTYKRKVPWMKGNAWIANYATHYATSRHFIGRSLSGKRDYLKQDVKNGDQFNVLRTDIDLNFHLVIDTSRAQMWFYYHDKTNNKRDLLKTYPVGLGRPDSHKASGSLTPLGVYQLGDNVMTYVPGQEGLFRGEKREMIQIFGTRWMPFAKEIADSTEPARGFGIHGTPWLKDATSAELREARESVGRYESDGCIRMNSEDVEELFAIVITRPTFVHLVKDVASAKLP